MLIFADGQAVESLDAAQSAQCLICLVPMAQADAFLADPGMEAFAPMLQRPSHSSYFESHEGFDYVMLLALQPQAAEEDPHHISICHAAGRLVILHEAEPAVDRLAARLREAPMEPPQALVLFFALLMQDDPARLEAMEEKITDLEDAIAQRLPDDCQEQISRHRRRLLALKRYYEGLFDLLEDMEENSNGLFGKKQLRALHLQTNRADRLSRTVLNLRDYVTQVREAYQAEMDLKQNEIMKLFTVVTTIFLPLTLIVGWFGMNFQMPEYSLPWAYPVVIVCSVLVVIVSILIFKKKGWF